MTAYTTKETQIKIDKILNTAVDSGFSGYSSTLLKTIYADLEDRIFCLRYNGTVDNLSEGWWRGNLERIEDELLNRGVRDY